jgi:hypothetical protein
VSVLGAAAIAAGERSDERASGRTARPGSANERARLGSRAVWARESSSAGARASHLGAGGNPRALACTTAARTRTVSRSGRAASGRLRTG